MPCSAMMLADAVLAALHLGGGKGRFYLLAVAAIIDQSRAIAGTVHGGFLLKYRFGPSL